MIDADARAELLGGQRFVWSPRTPLLRAMIDGAQRALEDALARTGLRAVVARERDLLLSPHNAMIPDLAVFRDGATHELPLLVIEYRAESTDRLFFGPKRLAYARAGLREVWFAEPASGTLVALRRGEHVDYPWPADTYARGERIRAASISELVVPVNAFFTDRNRSYEHR